MNIATLAYHFKGKEGLYKASIDRLYETFMSVTPQIDLAASTTPAEKVDAAIRFLYRFCVEHQTEVRLLLRHVLEHGHLPERVHEGWVDPMLERAEIAWALLGLAPDPDWKLKILAMNHLIARFAITSDRDFGPFTDSVNPHRRIEDMLVEMSLDLLAAR